MPSEVPAVSSTRSAVMGTPRAVKSSATASRAGHDARRRAVAVVAVAHRLLDGLDQVRRRLEAERDRVADVQVLHRLAGGLDFLRLGDDVADGVGEPVDAAGDRERPWTRLATGMAAGVTVVDMIADSD